MGMFDEEEFKEEIKKKVLATIESKADAKEIIEETIRDLTQQLKEAKSEKDLELLERKIDILEDMLSEFKVAGRKSDKEDVEELREIMGILSESVPKIMDSMLGPIKELINETYDPEKAERFGKNVASFYKELVGAGMDPDKAFELTKEYMESVNVIKTLVAAFMKEKMGKLDKLGELKKLGKKRAGDDFEEEL